MLIEQVVTDNWSLMENVKLIQSNLDLIQGYQTEREEIAQNIRAIIRYIHNLEKEMMKMAEEKRTDIPVDYWIKISKSGKGVILQNSAGQYIAFGNRDTLQKLLNGEKKALPLKKMQKKD